MPKISYQPKQLSRAHREIVIRANSIINTLRAQGYDLTLRQLYYQMVSQNFIANKASEYDRLGTIINDARLAGYVDWLAIIDRTREVRSNPHWSTPNEIIESAATSYQIDKWKGQTYRVEVWIEKDALVGVIERTCRRNDVAYFSCRGYTSQSEMWAAARRLMTYEDAGQQTIILHLGDHDPSGIDMSRDIATRMRMFCQHHGYLGPTVKRIGLTMAQIRQYNPPPNPAKLTDCRAEGYIALYGMSSWELDALTPQVLDALIQTEIETYRNDALWKIEQASEAAQRATLKRAERHWSMVANYVATIPDTTPRDVQPEPDTISDELAALEEFEEYDALTEHDDE